MFFYFSSRFFLFGFLLLSFSGDILFAETLIKEATYYADGFEWGRTANGDTFHQSSYSAALCDVPLGSYAYVSHGGTGVVVDINDRPNCSHHPEVIDLSRDVFRLFGPLTMGRISPVEVTVLGASPAKREKWFLPLDTFSHLSVTLTSPIPTVLFAGEWVTFYGKTDIASEYVIVYLSHIDGTNTESRLVEVHADNTFQIHLPLPKKVGEYTFVIAQGKGFNTEKYATLTLIDKNSLVYPDLPPQRYRFTPHINREWDNPSISLPKNTAWEITLRQWINVYKTSGTTLVFSGTGLLPGKTSVQIEGSLLSTTSPLDQKSRVVSFFSGEVILDRSHDTIGSDNIYTRIQWSKATFRFTTPSNYKIRPNYYVTLPNGDVKSYAFDQSFVGSDKFLLPGVSIKTSFPLPTDGVYMLEIVRQDGIAHVNIPLIRGRVWSILKRYSLDQIRTLRSSRDTIVTDTLLSINTLRTHVGKKSVTLDPDLMRLAQAKVDDMILRSYQSHADPDGRYVDWLAEELGIQFVWSLGENIGYGTVSDLALQDWLEESWVHRYNMLESLWNHVGIGYGTKEGKVYLVHIFGE